MYPIFGVLIDDDVDIDFTTCRPKISKEILDEMRQYLSVQDGTERQARVERIRKQVWELEEHIQGQRMLRLEAAQLITSNLDKRKGVVLQYKEKKKEADVGEKLLHAAISAGENTRNLVDSDYGFNAGSYHGSLNSGSTGNNASFYLASTSGTKSLTKKTRGPSQWRRKTQAMKSGRD